MNTDMPAVTVATSWMNSMRLLLVGTLAAAIVYRSSAAVILLHQSQKFKNRGFTPQL